MQHFLVANSKLKNHRHVSIPKGQKLNYRWIENDVNNIFHLIVLRTQSVIFLTSSRTKLTFLNKYISWKTFSLRAHRVPILVLHEEEEEQEEEQELEMARPLAFAARPLVNTLAFTR